MAYYSSTSEKMVHEYLKNFETILLQKLNQTIIAVEQLHNEQGNSTIQEKISLIEADIKNLKENVISIEKKIDSIIEFNQSCFESQDNYAAYIIENNKIPLDPIGTPRPNPNMPPKTSYPQQSSEFPNQPSSMPPPNQYDYHLVPRMMSPFPPYLGSPFQPGFTSSPLPLRNFHQIQRMAPFNNYPRPQTIYDQATNGQQQEKSLIIPGLFQFSQLPHRQLSQNLQQYYQNIHEKAYSSESSASNSPIKQPRANRNVREQQNKSPKKKGTEKSQKENTKEEIVEKATEKTYAKATASTKANAKAEAVAASKAAEVAKKAAALKDAKEAKAAAGLKAAEEAKEATVLKAPEEAKKAADATAAAAAEERAKEEDLLKMVGITISNVIEENIKIEANDKQIEPYDLASFESSAHQRQILETFNKVTEDRKKGRIKTIDMFRAIEKGDIEAVKCIIDVDINKLNIISKSHVDRTPLHCAAFLGKEIILQLLLTYNAEIDPFDADGNTPLMLAAYAGHFQIIEMLAYANASVSHSNSKKNTALHLAVVNNHHQCVDLLINLGSKIQQQNSNGETPMDLAKQHHYSIIIESLEKVIKK